MTAYYTGNYHNLVGCSQKLQQMQSLSTPSATPQDLRKMACREENPTYYYDSSPPPKLTRIHSNLPRVSNSCGELVGKIASPQAYTLAPQRHPLHFCRQRNQTAQRLPSTVLADRSYVHSWVNITLFIRSANIHYEAIDHESDPSSVIRTRQRRTGLSAVRPDQKAA